MAIFRHSRAQDYRDAIQVLPVKNTRGFLPGRQPLRQIGVYKGFYGCTREGGQQQLRDRG